MRVRTLEIRWHDGRPIYACDFQPLTQPAIKKIIQPRIVPHNASENSSNATGPATWGVGQSFRFATGGSDNHVRMWMVYPNILPPSLQASGSTPPPPRVEYLATLAKHAAVVNVVRFCPNGEYLASAGDDGMVMIWAPTDKPTHTFGQDPEEAQYEKEHWKPRIVLRCTSREVYDLAWSPNGEFIIAGSTDNTARVYNALDGTCVREIAEHSHYVQGVAWDPLNEFIASQSSDRSVHVYGINTKRGSFDVHAIGKNAKLHVRHSRTPSNQTRGRPSMVTRRGSASASDVESVVTSASELKEDQLAAYLASSSSVSGTMASSSVAATPQQIPQPPTPTMSISSTPSMFPPKDRPASRRSSFSNSNAPSPSISGRHIGRSPSPMPPLPAIRAPPPSWTNFKMYGDESYTNFFRRLTFSPDGAFLLTPAGQFEDQTVNPQRPKKGLKGPGESKSSVYIYSRANFARPPVAHLPGHSKASVAVKFSPLLYELRALGGEDREMKKIGIERGKDMTIDLELGGPAKEKEKPVPSTSSTTGEKEKEKEKEILPPPPPTPERPLAPRPSVTPVKEGESTNATATGSVFSLPYRMLYSVATQDTIMIYDTQQAGPICMFTNLHYASFTDMSWAPDGQSLMLASSDGYCSIVVFDEILPLHHTQQHNLQMQSIVQSHSNLVSPSHPREHHGQPLSSPALSFTSSIVRGGTPSHRRTETGESIQTNNGEGSSEGKALGLSLEESGNDSDIGLGPPAKKKRRIALTTHSDAS